MKSLASKPLAGVVLSVASIVFTLSGAAQSASPAAKNSSAIKLVHEVKLPGYTGDFDHFAIDRDRGRILVAAEDHATLEVFDLKTKDHLKTITGFGAPHSLLVRPGVPTIFVTDSEKMSTIRNANTYAVEKSVTLVPGADSSGYDAAANIFYIVTGGKDVKMKTANIEAVNPDTGAKLGSITFNDNHVEAMAVEKNGPRIFINLAQTNKLAVVNRKTMSVIATWPVPPAQENAMVAFDEPAHRLYVVCRKPGMVVVMNSDTGAVIDTAYAPLRADDVLFNQPAHRLYVPGGEGFLTIYDTTNPNKLVLLDKVPTAPGAKTGLLLPQSHELMLAASPGDTGAMAKILTYSIP